MDATMQNFRRWEWDPFLVPNWRFKDAQRLAAGEEPEWSADDPAIVECAVYLGAIADAHNDAERAEVEQRWPELAAAHKIAQQDDPRRWEIEARLLARQSDEEVAARYELLPDVVAQYELVYYNVRPRIDARMWVTNQVLGPGIHQGFGDHDVGPIWAIFGYHGGPIILDAVVGAFHAAWRPGEPATVSVYLRPDNGIDPRLQANVAALVLPPYGPAREAWRAICIQLVGADAVDDPDRHAFLRERARDYMIGCARAHLAGKPLPRIKRRPQRSQDRGRSKIGTPGFGTRGTSLETMVQEAIGSAMVLEPKSCSKSDNAGSARLRRP